jgi:3-dehydroquinate synthase/2-deoxy-scyllo-inosose synthase
LRAERRQKELAVTVTVPEPAMRLAARLEYREYAVRIQALIRLGVAAKMSQLEIDAHERIAGMVFEYGHTIGHALEKAYGDGTVPHGVGVAYGMMACSYVSETLGHMSADDRAVHDRICRLVTDRWPLPEPRPALSSVMSIMMRDSKRGIAKEQPHEISDVLLRSVGDTIHTSTQNLSKFSADLVRQFLSEKLGFSN